MDTERGPRTPADDAAGQELESLRRRVAELERALVEQTRVEDLLRAQAEEIHDLYNKAPCGYHSLDKDGLFLRINDTELGWLGYTREEVVGKMTFSKVVTQSGLQKFRSNFDGFMERGWVRDLEFDMVRKDGSRLPIVLSATAVKDAEGNFLMSRSTVFDITERRLAEAAAVAELSSPLLAISDRAVVMPLIGTVDSMRAQQILTSLLEGISKNKVEVAIIDITGVAIVDTHVADVLIRTARAARLLGAQVVLTGMQPEVAQALTVIGVELGDIIVRGTLQSGISYAMEAPVSRAARRFGH
ncbi:MAG TPA: STAS domain-containing protein [Polyangiaceae bacterium]|jgi:PAS domain S-box-containing protein|nr:STAS domain-containing protein [Polyangiaceae bacterium]